MGGLHDFIADLDHGRDLTDAGRLIDALGRTEDESSIEALFQVWHKKGISENEIYSLARGLRDRCVKVHSRHDRFVDVVGSGASRAKTFNVSTAAAFVVAGAGVPVAKHGNRAATSSSGSADVLAELGIAPASEPSLAEHCLETIGICFLFAPSYHRLPPLLGKVRRQLGFPTIFNCVGPLCNPALVPYQLVGVWDAGVAEKMAGALARLGTVRSWIVHSQDGLDEIGIERETRVFEVQDGAVTSYTVGLADFGLKVANSSPPRASSAAESASIVRDVLTGNLAGSAAEAVVLVNAAAALFVCGRAHSLAEGVDLAIESIRTGGAISKLEQLAIAMKER